MIESTYYIYIVDPLKDKENPNADQKKQKMGGLAKKLVEAGAWVRYLSWFDKPEEKIDLIIAHAQSFDAQRIEKYFNNNPDTILIVTSGLHNSNKEGKVENLHRNECYAQKIEYSAYSASINDLLVFAHKMAYEKDKKQESTK